MAADASVYAALGIDPAADDAEIERAYKRLIKRHHPDRQGGDSARAAEINRAYNELRRERDLTDPLELNEDRHSHRGARSAWLAFALLLIMAGLFLRLSQGSLESFAKGFSRGAAASPVAKIGGSRRDLMDQPLHEEEIDGAVRLAVRLARNSDEMALANASRDCHHGLRSNPSVVGFDRCAAFDDAVVQLQDRDPLRDQGPFSELAVTGRVWSAASALSEDAVAIDDRLDRIRLQVELNLAAATRAPPKGA